MKITSLLTTLLVAIIANAQPVIQSLSPASGTTGIPVTISGTGFAAQPADNIVFFGGMKATVTSASANALVVQVPAGVAYEKISVTTQALTATSPGYFSATFPIGGDTLSAHAFINTNTYQAGSNPRKVIVADMNLDGLPDMIVTNQQSNTITVLRTVSLNNGTPVVVRHNYQAGPSPFELAARDIDGDGKLDIICTNSNSGSASSVSVFHNTSTSTSLSFATRMDMPTGNSGAALAVGDLDNDGKPDIVVSNSNSYTLSFFRNTSTAGAVSFQSRVDSATAYRPERLAIGDVDGDGKQDILVSTSAPRHMAILRNISSGSSLLFTTTMWNVGSTTTAINLADVSGDGKPEILYANLSGSTIGVVANTSVPGTISFATPVELPSLNSPHNIAVADFDSDGKPDLATSSNTSNSVSVFKNISTAGVINFAPRYDYNVSSTSTFVTAADVNVDGKPDLVVSGLTVGVALLHNRLNEPKIFSFTPAAARTGQMVTIKGKDFTNALAVTFGGVPASSFTVVSDTLIHALPANSGSGSIGVQGVSFTGYLPGFTLLPSIASVTPTAAPVGTQVTIKGSGFYPIVPANHVYFGIAKATIISVTDTTFIVTVPAGATFDNVSVTANGLTVISPLPFTPTYTNNIQGLNASSFARPVTQWEPYTISRIATADFDNDGRADLVFTSSYSNALSFRRNISTTTSLSFAARQDITNNNAPASMLIHDMNGDGKKDVLTANTDNNTVSYYRNISTIGNISMFFSGTLPGLPNSNSIVAGDVDGDGKPDIVLANHTANTISVFRNMSTNISSVELAPKVDFATGAYPLAIAIADLDTDGKAEIIVSNEQGSSVSIFKNNSDPGNIVFAPQIVLPSGTYPRDIEVRDLNGDGKPDIIVPSLSLAAITVFENTSTASGITFNPRIDIPIWGGSNSFTVADADGDGKADIIAGNVGRDSIVLIRNTSAGGVTSFAPAFGVSSGDWPVEVSVADFDVDGQPDILYMSGSYSFDIMRNIIGKAPEVASFSPATAAAGTTITVKGRNFTGATAVSFGGQSANAFTVVSDTLVTAIVGNGATGHVVISTPNGTGTRTGFTFVAKPIVHGVTPGAAPVGSIVVVSGENFATAAANNIVYFGSVRAEVLSATATSITVKVPKGAAYKPVSVTVNRLTTFSPAPFNITFANASTSFSVYSFAKKVDLPVIAQPKGVAAADFTGNGKPDIVVSGDSHVVFLKNYSDSASFTFSPYTATTTQGGPTNVTVADFDGDGMPDVAIGKSADINAAGIFRNAAVPGETFVDSELPFSFSALGSFVVNTADVDQDGKMDLLIASMYAQRLFVFRNASTGNILQFDARIDLGTVNSSSRLNLAAGDLNGDGRPEVVLGNFSNNISIYRNTSVAGVVSFVRQDVAVTSAVSITIADADGDGKNDIVTGSAFNQLMILRNTTATPASITFAAAISYDGGNDCNSVTMADLDGDGKPDAVMGNYSNNTISVYKNNSIPGTILFAPRVTYATGTGPGSLFVADMDVDGKLDIVVANRSSNTVSILRNQLSEPISLKVCPGGGAAIPASLAGTSYQWEVNKGNGFVAVVNDSNHTGATTATLNLVNVPSSFAGYSYRSVINGVAGVEVTIRVENQWTGSVDFAWENPANWSCGSIPDANTEVVIKSGYVEVNASTTIRSLVLSPAVSLTIKSGVVLNVLK